MYSQAPAPQPPLVDVIRVPGYAARAIDLIEQVHRAPDAFTLVDVLRCATCALGADSGVYVHAIPGDDARTVLKVLMACDPLRAYAYARNETLDRDAWFRYARDHFEPVLASELYRSRSAGGDHSVPVELGFHSALIVPTQGGGGIGRFGVLYLGSALAGNFEASGTHLFRVLAHSLSLELHEWWMHETRSQFLEGTRLSTGELQLLAMERHGLGTKQIARTLGIGLAAVNSRFQRINVKLRSSSRRVSALKAATQGLL